MKFLPLKTRKFLPPKDDLYALLNESLPKLKEKDLLFVTSKIVSISQGRTVPCKSMAQKIQLIKQEADAYFPQEPHGLTLKDQTLTPYAGIDRSNANNHYVLWPRQPHLEAKKIWTYLKTRHHLQNLGMIIIDSFCLPLRWGHMGISIGFYGFHPNRPYTGQKDIFNHKIIQANSNLIDALSAFAGILMGEGNEQTPLLLARGCNFIKFTSKNTLSELKIPADKSDLYSPLLANLKPVHY